jgi:hypothetical protein
MSQIRPVTIEIDAKSTAYTGQIASASLFARS